MRANTLLTATCIFLLTLNATAQDPPKLAKRWNAGLDAPVEWMRASGSGPLLVMTKKGLHGLDSGDGTVMWSMNDAAGLAGDQVRALEGSPYHVLTTKEGSTRIFHPRNGEPLFFSDKVGMIKFHGAHHDDAHDALIAWGPGEEGYVIAVVRPSSHDLLWNAAWPIGSIRNVEVVNADILLVTGQDQLRAVSLHSGKSAWDLGNSGGTSTMTTFTHLPGQDAVLLIKNTLPQRSATGGREQVGPQRSTVMAHDKATGKALWASELRLDHAVDAVGAAQGIHVLGEQRSGINTLVDAATGKLQATLAGREGDLLQAVIPVQEDVVLVRGGNGTTTFERMEVQGRSKWPEPVQVKGRVERISLLPSVLVVHSDQEVQVVNVNTGFPTISPTMPGQVATSQGTLTAYAMDRRGLFQLAPGKEEPEQLNEERLDLGERDKVVGITPTDGGILLQTTERFVLVDGSGRIVNSIPLDGARVVDASGGTPEKKATIGAFWSYLGPGITIDDGNTDRTAVALVGRSSGGTSLSLLDMSTGMRTKELSAAGMDDRSIVVDPAVPLVLGVKEKTTVEAYGPGK